jgi:two-component system, cell cycle sensor histidine kinase and response regulator CckA
MNSSNPLAAVDLRRRAEKRLSEKQSNQHGQAGAESAARHIQRLVQELQIHQIELEIQNEELEQARAETQAALERYTDLYEFAPAGYFNLDRDGMIRQANLTGSRLLGVERSRLVNRPFGQFVAENSRSLFRTFSDKVFASQSLETCEVMLLREGKPFFHARIEARSSGDGRECRAVVLDITEGKRIEEKIQEQANLLELAHDAIFVRGLDEKIRYWNKGAEQLYGWTAEEAIGRDFGKMAYEDRTPFEAAKQILLREGLWSKEVSKLTKGRRSVVVASRWTLMRDRRGNPNSILVIDTDITEKKQMEAQFLRAQRLELIGTLAGGIAHDLNNILQIITTNLDLAASAPAGDERLPVYFADASEGASRAVSLARRLLTFSKGGSPIKQPLDLAEILTNAVHLALSGSNIKAGFAFQRDLHPVIADSVQLAQVIENLVINAREATPQRGKLLVRAENFERSAGLSGLPASRFVRVQIEDGGTGIPENIRERIFDAFFTTKAGGSGLGLATVKSIVEQHGGSITIDSVVGRGTTVSLLLPVASQRPEAPVASLPSPAVKTTGRILVIDDEKMILNVVRSLLHSLGYECAVAEDGVEGCEKYVHAKANGNPFAAVLLDGTIPNGLSGEEALKLLLETDADARVILCSGYAESDLFKNAMELGFKAVLSKPFSISELVSVFNKVLA